MDWRTLAWRPIPFALLGALLVRERGVPVDPEAPNRSAALASALSVHGLSAEAATIAWIGEGREPLAIVRASKGEDPKTLWIVKAKLSPEGVLLDVGTPHRLTKSTGVEETPPAVHGARVATAIVADGVAIGVKVFDLDGEPPPEGPSWTAIAKAQNALTNLQETGRLSGIGQRSFQLVPAVKELTLKFDHGELLVSGEGHEARVPEVLPKGTTDPENDFFRPQPSEKGQVGNVVTWAVDRVRAMEWFGDETMQRLKAIAFDVIDMVTRAKSKVGTDTTARDIQQDLGDVSGTVTTYTDPETGWPPPRIEPYFKKNPIPGEGEWILLDKDPFVQVNPGAPPAFATTFVRTDKERPYTRIYITIWDPRQVELHPMAGAAEPVDAAGNAGPGLIPRTPKVMKRVVGAFNGGFQAMHGEFGLMSDGKVYLPPKPYAATVAEMRDGSTGFGVWPNSTEIPEEITGFRQNLTPLVEDMKWNPYQRTWWGGTPPGWPDRVHTTRSGICLTMENYVAYFYGNGIDAEVLGQAMIQARCKLGIHLDMNPGHTGLEFYRVSESEGWTPFGRAYQPDWETEGEVSGMKGFRFRARRMIRGMGLMNFPRYIQRESRDFFYLVLRRVLPGADLPPLISPPEANEGKWRTSGLPQHGFPYAIATTTIRPDTSKPDFRITIVKVDPRTVTLTAPKEAKEPPVVLTLHPSSPGRAGEPTLWLGKAGFAISKQAVAGSSPLLAGSAPGTIPNASAVVGIGDDDGDLYVAEVETGQADANAVDAYLSKLGCSSRLWMEKSLSPLLGGTTTLANVPAPHAPGPEIRLFRGDAPGGRFLFPDTPIVPYTEWGPLQQKRIRYFKHPENEPKKDDTGSGGDP